MLLGSWLLLGTDFKKILFSLFQYNQVTESTAVDANAAGEDV